MRAKPLSWWVSEFTEIAPIGHVLLNHFADNWTRFHSLPDSKRYAENEAEYSEILRRHLAIGSELFDIREPLYVYRSHLWVGRKQAKRRRLLAEHLMCEKGISLPSKQCNEFEGEYCVHALITTWVPKFFEVLTREIADWKETGITFVSPRTKNIYCPYDGGVDIFTFPEPPNSLEEKFNLWMSSREDKR